MTSGTLVTPSKSQAAYRLKDERYFAGARDDMIDDLPFDPSASILEIGCGSGETGQLALERQRARRYVGIELMEVPAARAREVLSEVLVGDVEEMELPYNAAEFDGLILSEVLEHLREPEQLLRRLNPLVRPGGHVLASSPNISHWKVIRELVMGRFPQADRGVFDRTHLRWFTPESFAAMFERAGFEVEHVRPVARFTHKQRTLLAVLGSRFQHLFMTQVAIVARKR